MKINKNNNGKWIIDFTCKGRRVIRVIGENKKEAEEAMALIKADILRERYGFARSVQNIRFEEFAEEYDKLHCKKKRSWKRDKTSLKNLEAFFKGKGLASITPDLIEKYKIKREKDGLAPASINRELALLKNLYTKAVEWGKTEKNPTKGVHLLKENNIKERILKSEETCRLIEASAPSIRPILIIALNTGMRKMEILALRWEDIYLDAGYIFIKDTKSGNPRKIPMNRLVKETLAELRHESEYIFFNPETKNHIMDIKKAFATACRKAEIKGLRLHDLRHTAATRMIQAGVDLVTVSRILGHASIQMTMRYAHPTPENMQRAVDCLGEIFEGARKKIESPDYANISQKPVSPLSIYN